MTGYTIRDSETKECLRGRSSYLVFSCCKKSVRVQEARGVKGRLTLCSLSGIVCLCLCVCLALPPFFHLTCINTFSHLWWCFSSFSSPPSQQLCLFHVLFLTYCWFLIAFRRTVVSVMLSDTFPKWWYFIFQLGPKYVIVCRGVTGRVMCETV